MISDNAKSNYTPSVIIFRCDDYSIDGGLIEQVEHDLVDMIVTNNLRLVYGLIPKNLGTRPDKISFLKPYVASGVIEIALHGWDHEPSPELLTSRGVKSEFVGRSYEEQFNRISNGKYVLENWFEQPIQSFIPPWNQYDFTTLKACADTGFEVLSANIFAPINKKYSSPMFLPSMVMLPALENLVQSWEEQPRSGRTVVVEFHAYEFYESGYESASFSLEKFGQILECIAHSPNIISLSLSETVQRLGPKLTNHRYLMAQRVDRSAAKIYQSTWRNRIGNHLNIPVNLKTVGYETTTFYYVQYVKQQLIYYLPLITFISVLFFVMVMFWLYYV